MSYLPRSGECLDDWSRGVHVLLTRGINPTNATATTVNGPAIDRQGFMTAVLLAACGAPSGAPSSFTVATKVQDSGDGITDWVDVAGATVTTFTMNNTEGTKDLDLKGMRRYLRVVQTVAFVAGTTPAIPISAAVLLGSATAIRS